MNPVDAIFAVLIVLALVRGYSRGLLATAAGYVAPVAAFMLAADWSDPVRDRIAAAMPAPDVVLDILAPLCVFVVVVAVIRLAAAFLSRLLGLGLSAPSRVLAAAAGATVTMLVLGSIVVVVDQMSGTRQAAEDREAPEGDDAAEAIASPARTLLLTLDRRFDESMLGPPLARLAAGFVDEAMELHESGTLLEREKIEEAAREAAAAAVNAAGKAAMPPAGDGKNR